MLPFQSLLHPPFLKGCDELPNQPHDLRPFEPATAVAHPYLHVNSTSGIAGGTTLAGFGQRKNRQVTRDDLEVVLSHAEVPAQENPRPDWPALPAREGC